MNHQSNLKQENKKEIVRLFLLAWHESITHQHELVPQLAETVGIEPAEMVYYSQIPPYADRFQWGGMIRGTQWKFFFHGIADCNLYHEDGRYLEISFGPYGRYDVFSGWNTLQFVMASKSPWSEFADLKDYLAAEPPPYTSLSGDYHKMRELDALIAKLKLFDVVDRQLYQLRCELEERYKDGTLYSPPAPYNDPSTRIFWDLEVSGALVLSERGQQIFANELDSKTFSQLWEKSMIC